MLRNAREAGIIVMLKTSAAGNVSDILTKRLTSPSFERHRATMLILAYLSEATRETLLSDLLPTIPPHPGHIACGFHAAP